MAANKKAPARKFARDAGSGEFVPMKEAMRRPAPPAAAPRPGRIMRSPRAAPVCRRARRRAGDQAPCLLRRHVRARLAAVAWISMVAHD